MTESNHTIHEDSNGRTSIWTFSMGDDEEEIAMWEGLLVSPGPAPSPPCLPEEEEDDFSSAPARGPISLYNDQEVEQYVKTSVSEALARARKRHLERRTSSSLSPRGANTQKSPTLSPKPRRLKVSKSMVSALPLHNVGV